MLRTRNVAVLLAGLLFVLTADGRFLPAAENDSASEEASADPTPGEFADQVEKAKADRDAAAKALEVAENRAKALAEQLEKLKTDAAGAREAVEAAQKALEKHQQAVREVAEKQAEALRQTAEEAETRAKSAAEALASRKSEIRSTRDRQAQLKAEIAAAEMASAEAEKQLKPQEEAAQQGLTQQQTLQKEAEAAARVLEEAQKLAKLAADKAAQAAQQAAEKTAALEATRNAITQSKQTVAQGGEQLKQTETLLSELQAQADQQETAFAAVSVEALEKLKAAETALIGVGKLVSFSHKVAPVFATRCLACHNARTGKGRLNMETFAGIMKGGESGAVIEPGDADLSTLALLVEDGSMPQDADPLAPEEIELIKKWIDTGARLDAGLSDSEPLIAIMPKPEQPMPPETYRIPVPVTTLAFSPDGSQLTSSGYHEVLVWNPVDGQPLRRIVNLAERVYDIGFSPDGAVIAVAAGTPGEMGEVKLFQAADGAILADLMTTGDSVFAVAFSPDGKRLATGGADRAIRIFDVATGEQQLLIEDHADWVMGLAWSPDGTKLASASRDKTSKVFDMQTGESMVTFNAHGEPVFGVGFTPDGKQVVSCGRDKQIRIWNVEDAKAVRNIGGFGDEVFRIQVTPDGRVFSASADKTARLHTLADGKEVRKFSGHDDWVYSVAYDAAGKRLATGAYNGEIRTWNVEDGSVVVSFVAAPTEQTADASAASAGK